MELIDLATLLCSLSRSLLSFFLGDLRVLAREFAPVRKEISRFAGWFFNVSFFESLSWNCYCLFHFWSAASSACDWGLLNFTGQWEQFLDSVGWSRLKLIRDENWCITPQCLVVSLEFTLYFISLAHGQWRDTSRLLLFDRVSRVDVSTCPCAGSVGR